MGRGRLYAPGRVELSVDDRVLLWPPRLRRPGVDVFDPALDGLDALLTVASVLRVEVFTHV
jgi:hypothetical protein